MRFSSEHLNRVFSEVDYEGAKQLMFDLATGKEIVEDGKVISKSEANEKVREICFSILGVDKNATKKEMKRAFQRHGLEFFEVIEDVIDLQISTGWATSEWFEDFVEMKNIAEGDENSFYTEKDIILNVAKVAGDHHDLTIQTLGEGESFAVPTSVYAVKVGKDIDLFLTGRKNWADFTAAVAKAFMVQIKNTMYAEVMKTDAIPAQFKNGGTLDDTAKETFDTLIEDVQTANDGAPVIIMGTKTALKKISGLSDVDWRADSQKEDVAATGRLGSYEGTMLFEIPQRFAPNDTTKKLVDPKKLLIVPMAGDKFVKFVDGGESTLEVTEKGANMDDFQTLEVQRTMGVATILEKIHGVWTLV